MSEDHKDFLLAAGYNVCLALVVAAITLGGVALTGEWWGLWSLLLMLLSATKSKDDSKSDDAALSHTGKET